MGSVNIKHESSLLSNSSLIEVSLSGNITDDHSILIHRLNVLPRVLVLVESVVMAFTIWARLIAVDLSIVKQVSVVVASWAVLHLIVRV